MTDNSRQPTTCTDTTETGRTEGFTRRTYLTLGSGVLAGALAGCLGGGGDQDGGGSGRSRMLVLHGWTGGDGKKAIANLIKGFREEYPDIKGKFRPIGGGGNTNLDTAIKNRAQNDNLPSSWSDWPGENLVQFAKADLLGDIGDIWSKNQMEKAYSEEAKRLSKVQGTEVGKGPYVTVPLGSHRLNELFFNKSVVEKAGVDPTTLSTPADLLSAMETVEQKTDAVGMAQGQKQPWTTVQLWAVILLGQSGYQAYMDFIDGKGSKNAVRKAFQMLDKYAGHFNKDASTNDFTTANQKIMKGEAAFIHQGNWVAGAYRNQENFEYKKDWGAVRFPGTKGLYTLHFDSFPFPKNASAPENTKKYLEYLGTKDAQIRFNKFKGSIPPRTDVPTDKFDAYLTETIDMYANAKNKPPTIAHGLAVQPDVMSDFESVITDDYLGSGNIENATNGMINAVSNQ